MHVFQSRARSPAPRRIAEDLLALYRIDDSDLERIVKLGRIVVPRMDDFVDGFYGWLATQPEYEEFFSDPRTLESVKRLQRDYWREFFDGKVDDRYLDVRRGVGHAHARIGLPLGTYLAGMNVSLGLHTETLYDGSLSSKEYAATIRSTTKLAHLDTSLVVEAYSEMVREIVGEQNRSLLAMSTPVTAIWEGILMLPIVGIIDSKRSQDIMNAMLTKIAETRARVFILDISGVAVVDTAVANHLIKITKATKLMGCECTISGVSPAIAQTVVELGIDVGSIRTTATMRDALAAGFAATGTEIRQRVEGGRSS